MRSGVVACLCAVSCASTACVPEGPATGDGKTSVAAAPRPKPSVAAPASSASAASLPVRPAITGTFEDAFDRAEIGPDWNVLGPKWKIQNGRLCARGAKNRGIWLLRKLPVNARIEFDAIAETAEGDLKVELWGDGQSGATSTTYDNATSYLAILGGWKNSKHVLARLDEHGDDRLEMDVEPGADDERARPVEAGQPYRFKIERKDGKTIGWSVNGLAYFELPDDDPLVGAGHEHLGFNDWDSPVCFDNLRVTPL